MAQINVPFNEPYSLRADAAALPLPPWAVALDGTIYLVDTASEDWRRTGVDVLQQRNTGDQRDTLLLPQDVWRQQQFSWHQGAGQSNLDRDDALPYRFDDSFGIDPWDRWQIKLLPSTALMDDTPTADKPMFLRVHTDKLVAACGDTLYWWSTLGGAATTQVPSAANDVIDMTYDGDSIITLHADGKVYKTTDSATTALYGTWAGSTFIEYVKDYLLIGHANVLKNINSAGSPVTVYTSPVAGFRWYGACEGLSDIYLIGGAGERSVVHATRVNTAGTALDPCTVAAMLPDGEVGYSIGGYLGFVFIGTSEGVRMGVLSSTSRTTSGSLTLGAIIPTDDPVLCFEGQDRFVWFGKTSISAANAPDEEATKFPASECSGIGRMDLSVFTTTEATPAWANDLVALDATGTVTDVLTWGGRRVFAVRGAGVYAQQDDLMEAGYLVQGLMSFSVEDDKTALYTQAKWLPLAGRIALDISYDSAGYSRATDLMIQDSIRSTNVSLNGTQFSRLNVRYVLCRSTTDAEVGPVLTRWEVRAIPSHGEAYRWVIPIRVESQIEVNGATLNRDPEVDYEALIGLYESRRLVSLQEAGRAHQVQCKNFSWKPVRLAPNGKSWEGIFTIVVEEIK